MSQLSFRDSVRPVSFKSNAVICLSKSSQSRDTCLFPVSAWAFDGKDYYRGLFTDAEALSLAFSTSDVPLIVREGTAHAYPFITSVISCGSCAVHRHDSPYDEFQIPFPARPHYCRRPVRKLSGDSCLPRQPSRQGGFTELIITDRNNPVDVDTETELHPGNIPARSNWRKYNYGAREPRSRTRRSVLALRIWSLCCDFIRLCYLLTRCTTQFCVFRSCKSKCDYTGSDEIAPLFALWISIRACTILFLSTLLTYVISNLVETCATKEK